MPTAYATDRTDLATQVEEASGQNAYLCLGCKKCTAGCPMAEHLDLTPHRLLRAIQLGQKETVLHSKTIWLCAACEACATRCPQGVDLPRIMDALKIMARREGVEAAVRPMPFFYDAVLRGVKLFGRMYEPGVMGELYLRMALSGDLDRQQLVKEDVPLAVKMLKEGKLKVVPPLSRSARHHSRLAPEATRLTAAYYPGCSLHATSAEYDQSTRAVAEQIGLKLIEPDGWVCCGTTPAHSTDHLLATLLPMRSLERLEQTGETYVTVPCPSCFVRFRTAIRDLAEDAGLREEVSARTRYTPSPQLEIDHLLTTITERVGIQAIAEAATRSLAGLKVVCYYGCVITRPPELTGAEHPEYPMNMDALLDALGAETLDWSHKTECCGVSLSINQLPIALDMSRKVLDDAKAVGAEAVVVACPLCHMNLDMRQRQIADR
ncbi:MAG: 4Fe-4S dicluster domain-containing protein, partial [Chloroflexi bacterium]|nr:4Fe-4S dicluster domain-containing protein [Chloroflexota bacterium]